MIRQQDGEQPPGRIVTRLDVMLARRKVTARELAAHIGITEQNLSVFKRGHARGVRFSTLLGMCEFLDCQPGDLLEYVPSRKG